MHTNTLSLQKDIDDIIATCELSSPIGLNEVVEAAEMITTNPDKESWTSPILNTSNDQKNCGSFRSPIVIGSSNSDKFNSNPFFVSPGACSLEYSATSSLNSNWDKLQNCGMYSCNTFYVYQLILFSR